MTEKIIASLRFEGKAEYYFEPPPKTFNVSKELVFSAARMTISGQTEGRTHSTRLYINFPDGSWATGLSTEVLDGEQTLSGANYGLCRLGPGDNYLLTLNSYGFYPKGEVVSITVDLLALDSTAAEVTRDVLLEAESEPGINAITFGISEASFTSFMSNAFTAPEVEVGTTPNLKVLLDVQSYRYPPSPFVHIDVARKEFVVTGELLLLFYRIADKPYSTPLAVVSTTMKVFGEPVMVTDTKDTLQIHFLRAELTETSASVKIHNEPGILEGYATIPEFRAEVDRYIEQIRTQSGTFGFALPAYLESRSMPDHWDHVLNLELNFRYFDYRAVEVHGLQISYLFIVFSARSLDLPPPCYCEHDSNSAMGASVPSPAFELLPSKGNFHHLLWRPYGLDTSTKGNTKSILPQKWDENVPPGPAYFRIMDPAQIAAIGLSQNMFKQIAQPVNMGHDASSSTGGTVYASTRFWFRTTLDDLKVTGDGIQAIVSVAAKGTAKAAVRDKCRHDVLSKSVGLLIRCKESSMRWGLRISETNSDPPQLSIQARAEVKIGDITVDYDGFTELPEPLDQFEDWIYTTVANTMKPLLNDFASRKASVEIISAIENNGDIRLSFVDDEFFPEEAAVVLGQLNVFIKG